jgi:phosphoglucomutase
MIKQFINESNFTILIDAMNGITGPYASKIFLDMIASPYSKVMNGAPLSDFGGIHPDPNLTYAKDLVDKVAGERVCLGAAFDGDGDRNMVVAKGGVFVNPSDSVAGMVPSLIASYCCQCNADSMVQRKRSKRAC